MKFRYVILYVEDVQATLAFYQRAFGLEIGFIHDEADYGELITGDTKLAVSSKSLMRELGKTPGSAAASAPTFEIAFESDDVASAVARALDEGAILQQAARDESWGQITAYVSDPNGYLIEICTPM